MPKIEPLTDPIAFVDLLEKSGLFESDAVSDIRKTASQQTDAGTLARQLIKEGKLTKWQAYQLLLGTTRLTVAKYQLLDQIGKGPLGRVYLAEHGKLGKKVVMKVLSARFSSQPAVLKQFLEEANLAGALNHRNILHIFDAGNENERYYLVMEHVEGKDLQRIVEATGPLPPSRAIDLVRQAAEGLAYAHEQNLTHGDLKPSNLLVDASGVVKILDLGLSGLANHAAPGGSEESTEAASLASLAFRAPELLSGNQRSDVRSDLYSLGAVLHFLLAGKPPSRDENSGVAKLEQVPGVGSELLNLCDHLLATNPDERPESAAQVVAALELAARAVPAFEKPEKTADRSSTDRPSSAGKPKRPLVAKALEETAAPIIVTGEVNPRDSDSDPLAGFSIKTGRKRKASQPAAAAADAPATKQATAPRSPAVATSKRATRLPLILSAAIGGSVLVVAAVATIVLLVLNRGDSQQVASAKKDGNSAKASSAAPEATAQPGADEEANPELKPESNPSPGAETKSVGTKDNKKPAPADASEAPSAEEPRPPTNDKTAPQAMPAGTPMPPTAVPTPTEPKPPESTPPPPKPADTTPAAEPAKPPAPPPAANPLAGFANTVELPPLEVMGKPVAEALMPRELGPIKIEPTALCIIKLKGGESAFRGKTKFLLEPANQGTAERDWEFKLQNDNDPPIVIATMNLKENQLSFQWTEPATTEQAAPYLRNCVLTMAAGAGTHQVALRKPLTVDPLAMTVEKGAVSEKYNIEDAPSGKQIAVEIGPLEGGPAKHKVDPKMELEAFKDSTYVFAGNADDALLLGFKIDVSMSAKTLQITAQPQFMLTGMPKPERYVKNTLNQLVLRVGAGLQEANRNLEVTKQVKNADQKKRLEGIANNQLAIAQKAMAQVEQLKESAKLLQEGGRLHFRVYYLADDARVELINTGGPPPAPPMAKPAAK